MHPLDIGGAWFIMAGLSVLKDADLAPDDDAARWQQALEDGVDVAGERVVFHTWRGNAWRLNRVAYPHAVLSGHTVPQQGEALGRWVVQSFEVIRRTAVVRSVSPQ